MAGAKRVREEAWDNDPGKAKANATAKAAQAVRAMGATPVGAPLTGVVWDKGAELWKGWATQAYTPKGE